MGNGINCVYIGQTKDDKREGYGIELSQFIGKKGEEILAYRRGIFRKDEIYAGQSLTKYGQKLDLSEGYFKKGVIVP